MPAFVRAFGVRTIHFAIDWRLKMAKQYEVTLAQCATFTDMLTGKTWRKNQKETMGEAAASRFLSNPKFLVKELEPKVKTKPAPAPKEPEGGEPEGGEDGGGEEEPKAPAKKKVATKKKA